MAESFSVKALLSAQDKNMTSTFKKVLGTTDSLGSKLKSGIGFGALMSIGSGAMRFLGREVRNLMTEVNETNSAWKSFSNNMAMSGMGQKQIRATKRDLQAFAVKTVYSSKDMASTFAQLYAVNKKTTTSLVKGFGAVAAASENPKQAMKTISTQATQMAAKPTVAWQDFKLMLEQSPAGLAQVAKAMGMTTAELVKNVQDGKVKTEDFFKAMEKMADNKALMKQAQQYKTLGQAAEGLRAVIASGLAPAFDALTRGGVSILSSMMEGISKRFAILSNAFKGVGKAWGSAFSAIGKELDKLKAKDGLKNFESGAKSAASAMKSLASAAKANAKPIAYLIHHIPELIEVFIGLKIALKAAKYLDATAKGAEAAASVLPKVGMAAKVSGSQMLGSAKAFMATGAGVLMIAAGFYIMAKAAVMLAKSGKGAIGVFAGMAVAIGLLGVGLVVLTKAMSSMNPAKLKAMSVAMLAFGGAIVLCAAGMWILSKAAKTISDGGALAAVVLLGMAIAIGLLVIAFAKFGPALDAAIPAMLTFGAMVLMIGAGIWLAAKGIAAVITAFSSLVDSVTGLINVLPVAAQYGLQAAGGIALVGVACIVAAAGAIVLGIAMIAFGVMALATGAMLIGAGAMAMAGGIMFLLFGIMVGLAAVGVAVLALALKAVNSSMKSIASNARAAASSLSVMTSSVSLVKSGLKAIGDYASSAMNRLKSAFSNAASSTAAAGSAAGNNFRTGLSSGLNSAIATARSASNSIKSTLHSAGSGAYAAGVYIGVGLANGMASQLGRVRSIATSLSNAADVAIRKAQAIRSPSHKQFDNGAYIGQGLIDGIASKIRAVKVVSSKLAGAFSPQLGMAGIGGGAISMSEDYSYGHIAQYEVTVVTELDGDVVAKKTVKPMQKELNKLDKRDSRYRGRI
nr:tape measure protein [uncultured Mogibacterium sp.]